MSLLQRINMTSKMLQSEDLPIYRVVLLMRSLSAFIKSQYDRKEQFIQSGTQKPGSSYFLKQQRKVTSKEIVDIVDNQISQSVDALKTLFCINTFYPIIDRLVTELDIRIQAYDRLSDKFGLLRNFHERTPEELQSCSTKIVKILS